MVDRAIVEGVTEEELRFAKKKEITDPAAESIRRSGWKPEIFRTILQKASGKLRGFIQYIKELRNAEYDENGQPIFHRDLKFDVTPAPLPEIAKGKRPSSAAQEAEVMRLDNILQKMKKAEQRIYAVEKVLIRMEKERQDIDGKWFHGKEKKELDQKIAGKQQELKKAKATLAGIPGLHGYENALAVKKAYTSATKELDKIRNRQKEWDQKSVPEKQYLVIRSNKPEQRAERQSVLEQLDKKKREMERRQRTKKRGYDRDCL